MSDLDITHHPIPGRFVAAVEGHEASVDYEMVDGVMHITHTRVPEAIGGRGIAGQLVEAAFHHARIEGWKVRPLCEYAATWVRRHPGYADLVQ
jgi:predicted GNAT family acetyltransferase